MRNFSRNFMVLSIGCRPYMHRRRIATVYPVGHDTVLTTRRYLNWRFGRNTRFSSHFDPAAVCGRESNPPHCPEKLYKRHSECATAGIWCSSERIIQSLSLSRSIRKFDTLSGLLHQLIWNSLNIVVRPLSWPFQGSAQTLSRFH